MKRYALLIGVECYHDERVTQLRYAAADARDLGRALREQCGFEKVTVLAGTTREDEPTLSNIVRVLRSLAQQVRADDLFLFSFSGHGVEDDASGQGYLFTADSLPDHPTLNSLPLATLRDLLDRLEARWRILLVDACRERPQAGKGSGPAFMGEVFSRNLIGAAQAGVAHRRTTTLFSACSKGQRAHEWPEFGHGVFTHFILEGIRTSPRDEAGQLLLRTVAQHGCSEVTRWSTQSGLIQEPWLEQFGPDEIVLAAAGTGAPTSGPPPVPEPIRKTPPTPPPVAARRPAPAAVPWIAAALTLTLLGLLGRSVLQRGRGPAPIIPSAGDQPMVTFSATEMMAQMTRLIQNGGEASLEDAAAVAAGAETFLANLPAEQATEYRKGLRLLVVDIVRRETAAIADWKQLEPTEANQRLAELRRHYPRLKSWLVPEDQKQVESRLTAAEAALAARELETAKELANALRRKRAAPEWIEATTKAGGWTNSLGMILRPVTITGRPRLITMGDISVRDWNEVMTDQKQAGEAGSPARGSNSQLVLFAARLTTRDWSKSLLPEGVEYHPATAAERQLASGATPDSQTGGFCLVLAVKE